MENRRFLVNAEWDAEAAVYVATSDDVPGLVACGETSDELIESLKILVPELLELNKHLLPDGEVSHEISFVVRLRRDALVHVHA